MQYLLNQRYDGTTSINFIGTETINATNKVLILETTEPIKGISAISSINNIIKPNSNNVTVKFKFKNYNNWSELLDIAELTTVKIYEKYDLELKLYYYFVDGGKNISNVTISNITIECKYNIEMTDSVVSLVESNKPIVLEPKDTYKVYKIDDFQVIIKGLIDENDLDIKYRFTQDGGYNFTKWETLTKENLQYTSSKLNDLRFAKIQYLITKNASSKTNIIIYDIILIGDFQNVTADNLKSNRYGLREDCITQISKKNDSATITNNLIYKGETNGLSCYSSGDNKKILANLTTTNNANDGLWNPYKQAPQVTQFFNFLANQTNGIFGWDVEYYKTDPDKNGIDFQLHEYGLFNVTQKDTIKIIVPENQFPDNTIQINQFDLDLFNTFEIHILKDVFKNSFGEEERPAKNDMIFFCITNRLYYIKHAQVFKDIMNAGVYYKVILQKYENKSNINFSEETIKDDIAALTENTTIDELFGWENKQDADKISNKVQMYPKSLEKIRQNITTGVSIIKESINNGEVDFIQYHYDFNKLVNKKCVEYINGDNVLNVNENRTFISWFKFNSTIDENTLINKKAFLNYDIDKKMTYSLLNNYNEDTKLGYKYYYNNDNIYFTINNSSYNLEVPKLLKNVWYGVVINLNQRQNTIDIKLFGRSSTILVTYFNPNTFERVVVDNSDKDLTESTINDGFKPVTNIEKIKDSVSNFKLLFSKTFTNVEVKSFSTDNVIQLIGSDISYTNLRIFNEVIEDEHINNILNQIIIKDAGNLILADNANKIIYTKNVPNKNFK